jgi:transcription initiation factor TFIIIB Brf1 subunit/transcription initiation factor TFIIB
VNKDRQTNRHVKLERVPIVYRNEVLLQRGCRKYRRACNKKGVPEVAKEDFQYRGGAEKETGRGSRSNHCLACAQYYIIQFSVLHFLFSEFASGYTYAHMFSKQIIDSLVYSMKYHILLVYSFDQVQSSAS